MQKGNGFTLIELSIVLVIISLIVAGIVGGRELIRQAELGRILAATDGYKTALNAFKMKYDALPGDFKDATSYWPTAHIGNGDNIIDGSSGSTEYLQVWEHMGFADLVPGRYTGDYSNGKSVIGVNVPATGVTGVTCFISTPLAAKLTYGRTGTRLQCGGQHNDKWPEDPITTAAEAKSIDVKIDDGVPNKGKFYVRKAWTYDGSAELSGCVDQSSAVSAATPVNYLLSDSTKQCELVWWLE